MRAKLDGEGIPAIALGLVVLVVIIWPPDGGYRPGFAVAVYGCAAAVIVGWVLTRAGREDRRRVDAGLVIAGIAVREGRNAWKGDTCCPTPVARSVPAADTTGDACECCD